MQPRERKPRLGPGAIAAAKPRAAEYTLWDGAIAHFGLRVHPSGVKSFIVQTRVAGRMRKLTLGRYPEMGIEKARREAAAVLARLWAGEAVAPERKARAPLFRNFAARYRERRRSRWKTSSLETFDSYLRNRLMPHFGRVRLDAIDHARVSAWFDAASAEKPGAANRAFDILRAMLGAARQWDELAAHVPDACANIAKNPRRPVARFLDREELQRLGAALDRHAGQHPWPVAALRLLTLTGARLSEVLNLRWDEIGELAQDGASARLEDSKTGPRTVWLGPEAARLLAALPRPEGTARVFPEDLTSARLYTFWRAIREEAGLPGLRIHDARHTWASQGVMNGVGLTTVGEVARAPQAPHHGHLRPSGRCRAARCRRAGRGRHRRGDGLQGRAAAPARRGGGRRGRRDARHASGRGCASRTANAARPAPGPRAPPRGRPHPNLTAPPVRRAPRPWGGTRRAPAILATYSFINAINILYLQYLDVTHRLDMRAHVRS